MSMTPSPVFFPNDLITEIFSVLPVKSVLRFRCVSNSCNTLISAPAFVKLHLKRSETRNPHFLLFTDHVVEIKGESPYGSDDDYEVDSAVIPYSICSLIDNPSFTLSVDPYYVEKGWYSIVGSCNGLICLTDDSYNGEYLEYWLRLWNPATRTTSPILGNFRIFRNYSPEEPDWFDGYYKFSFGYDNSTGTYKAVASRYNRRELRSNVRILSLGDNVWRDIESFPVDPIYLDSCHSEMGEYAAVYFRSTLNWLAIQNEFYYSNVKDITVEQFVIVSLDLGSETYNQYLLPRGFDEVPPAMPTIGVLGDHFCFSYCYKEIDFVIWEMKKFGVENSWTPFLKISYHNLQVNYDYSDDCIKYHFKLVPLFLSEDGDTLILCNSQEREAIIYNWRNNRVERTGATVYYGSITDDRASGISWSMAKGYVESLVSIC